MSLRFQGIMLAAMIGSLCAQSVLFAATGPSARIDGDRAVLSNSLCTLTINSKSGEIISLAPGTLSLQGKWFEVVEESRTDMEHWETWKFGSETSFTGGDATVAVSNGKDTASLKLSWSTPGGNRVDGEIKLDAMDKGPSFRLKVTNGTGQSLVDKIRLPILRGITLNDPEDDWFTWPHTLGARLRVNWFKPGLIFEEPYPGFMYMQWLDLYDKDHGVYIGCKDDYGYSKSLFIGRDDSGQSTMGVSFTGCWIARKGDSWTTPWVQIVSHTGDWHVGADIYREFAQKAFGPINPPEIIKDMPTAQCWLAHQASNGDVGKLFEIQQQAPIHASYLTKSLNTSIPEGWDGFHGSGLEYQDSFDLIKELGGHSALFTFDRAVLMGRTNYADHASKWLNIKRDGSFEVAFKDMMPAPFDPDFTRARVAEAVRWVRDFNVDEIHYDTEGTCGYTGTVGTGMIAGPCYNMKMSQRPNEVPHYFKELYRKTVSECRKYNPDFTLRAEHCADFFYPEFSASTAHFLSTATGSMILQCNPPKDAQLMPMLFCYTLPQHAVYQMPSVSNADFWVYGYGMGYGFHGGGPSWCFNPDVRNDESPSGELLHRYQFYDADWCKFYDFRVGFSEAVIDGQKSDSGIQAQINGEWKDCQYPGPIVAVTHIGGGREVTLGMWYGGSGITDFGRQFADNAYIPQPTKLRIPTNIKNPHVRIYDQNGLVNAKYEIKADTIEADISDPSCFAVEVLTGPEIAVQVPDIAQPGKTASVGLTVRQDVPQSGKVTFELPAGWTQSAPVVVNVPAQKDFKTNVRIKVPDGIFGRNYPIKAIFTSGTLKRTVAAHIKVMEPLTFLYSFTMPDQDNLNCVDPGKTARLTVTCINNMKSAADISISAHGPGIDWVKSAKLDGIKPLELGNPNSQLNQWINGKASMPGNVIVENYDYQCTGITASPISIRISMNGKVMHSVSAYPRTRIMDLNGKWQAKFTRKSIVTVGGVEGNDFLDMQALTPDIWDGGWQTIETPLNMKSISQNVWAIYRRLVYIPAEWQGADVWLRLNGMGNGWGEGTMSLVYINGWPAGRIGQSGEKDLSPLLNYGGWNLIAIGAYMPDIFTDPYLFVRTSPSPKRINPTQAAERPAGAFILLNSRPSGQGISLPFIQGIPEGDHRRTDLKMGGENSFIYFSVADDYIFNPDVPVEVEIEYLDNGTGEINLDYDSDDEMAPVDGAFKTAEPLLRTNTGEWKTHIFVLKDARFTNRQHQGADFRLGGMKDDLHLRKVEVRLRK